MFNICPENSQLWDQNYTWNTTDPYFTLCFEESVLSFFPLIFYLIFLFIDVVNIVKAKQRKKAIRSEISFLLFLKTFLNLVVIILLIVHLIRCTIDEDENFLIFLSPSVQLGGYVLVLGFSLLTYFYNVKSSGAQFFFWFFSAIAQGILFRTAYNKLHDSENSSSEHLIYLTRLMVFPLVILRFIIELLNENTFCIGEKQRQLNENERSSPDKNSNFFVKLLFLWYDNLAWTGFRRTLSPDDLWNLNPDDKSKIQYHKFNQQFSKEKKKAANSKKKSLAGIMIPLIKCYGPTFLFSSLIKLSADLLVFVQPQMIRAIVLHVTFSDEARWKGFFYAGVITCSAILTSILGANSIQRVNLIGMRIRTALSNAVFRKALLISNASKKESTVGEIVNLMSVDSQRFSDIMPLLNQTIGAPVQISVASYLLYSTLGPSVFFGIFSLILLIPINGIMASFSRKYQLEQMKLKDERIKLTTEVLSGIKVLKLYAWEKPYQDRIEDIRNKELVCLRKIAALNTINVFIFLSAPIVVAIITFAAYVLSSDENVLTAEKTFVAMNLFNIIRLPLMILPMTVAQLIQTSVSLKRLNKYLNMEELDRTAVTHDKSYGDPVVIKDGSFSWTDDNITLSGINLNVKQGELVAVVGTIGAGKSSLLCSILGDLKKNSGIVNTIGSVAYVSQGAWIQNATVEENILFGETLNSSKYEKVLQGCSLKQDLEILDNGDQTEIGEKGINLSGGQKQRISLARAVYKDSSIYLLDDPLSAVDSHVGKHIFNNIIGNKGVLKNKTRILVTHGVSFLPQVDRIIVLKNGTISEEGSYNELLFKKGEFANFLLQHLGVNSEAEISAEEISVLNDLEKVIGADDELSQPKKQIYEKMLSRTSVTSSDIKPKAIVKSDEKIKENGKGKLIDAEMSQTGTIKMSIITNFIKSGGIYIAILAICATIGGNGMVGFSNIWLSKWSTEVTYEELEGNIQKSTTTKYLTGYGLIGLAQAILTLISTGLISYHILNVSKYLHLNALRRVLRAPMSYFDTTLLGRLLNRFGKDVDILDTVILMNSRAFINMFFNVLSTFFVITYTIPLFICFLIPLVVIYFFIQRFYVSTSRQLKRIESVTRSPIYSHFGETVSGSTTIRAFQMEEEFIAESERRIDLNQMSFFPFFTSSMWISIRLEFLGAILILTTVLFTLFSRETMDPGSAGLAITYAVQVTNLLNLLAKQMSDLESNIVSVERVSELTTTPQEASWESDGDKKPDDSWPDKGEIKFNDYKTRYREGLDLVLRGITFTIQPGEKVGVVGRTGAGKSSLTLALFRLIEPTGGIIKIDGTDISQLGLHDLRKKLTIIPQDPVLFSGTLRYNLDPFDAHTDDEIWKCLELAHLKTFVSSVPNTLLYKIEEEGGNLSVGQRQLVCLGRALLRRTKILVLDEATAAIDLETDDLIQGAIRHEFSNSSVITIAHRLNTILDYDKVLVLDKGEIQEFDSPQKLLQNPSSIFWEMAHAANLV